MKKIIFITFLLSFMLSCEKDDICVDGNTPHLIVRFFDTDDHSLVKAVTSLSIEVDSLGVFVPINVISTDSIVIPLRVDEDFTKIRLTKNTGEITAISDEFTLNYDRDEVFVSRSCGYKMNYLNVQESNVTTNWLNSLLINNQTILDEKEKHISIFH